MAKYYDSIKLNIEIPENLYFSSKRETGNFNVEIKPLKITDISSMTVVTWDEELYGESHINSKTPRGGIFYIIKYDRILTCDQFLHFLKEHETENFLLIHDTQSLAKHMRVFVETQPNILKLTFFSLFEGNGCFKPVAVLQNREGTSNWNEPQDLSNGRISMVPPPPDDQYHDYEFKFPFKGHDGSFCSDFLIFNSDGENLKVKGILSKYLYIPGLTRISSNVKYNSTIYYKLASDTESRLPIVQRYGITDIPNDDGYYYYYQRQVRIHASEIFPKSDLDDQTFNRISEKIKSCLNDPNYHCQQIPVEGSIYTERSVAMVKDIVAISAPIPGHRRPTYHVIRGIKHGGNIDVVEIARGELIIQQMIPESCYYLCNTGDYCRVTHSISSNVKSIINNAEIDNVSLNTWIDDKSLHPTLIKAVQQAMKEGNLSLPDIKLFNTVKFGSLFLEQLIKSKYFNLATALTRYINNYADQLNGICGSLNDILPKSNPEGTSLLSILNTSKPCAELILSGLDDENTVSQKQESRSRSAGVTMDLVETLTKQYEVVKNLAPNGILTKENTKLIQMYLDLYRLDKRWVQFDVAVGKIDVLNYPDELKSISKMVRRITELETNKYDNLRHYQEIVGAYFKLKSHGWNPDDYQIFIEFSLNGEGVDKMLRDREHAANTTLEIYRSKIEEATRKLVEANYASRLKTLKKLHSTKELEKNPLFAGYTIISPSQIYGETVTGSLEKEGADMHHCVFRSYANSVAEGSYTVLYLRNASQPDESLVTIGITNDGRINQTYALHDSMVSVAQARAISVWAKAKEGYVSFKSEGANVKPGGWNPAVEIVNLPKATIKI